MRNLWLGIDIGGTKCAVSIGCLVNTAMTVLNKKQIQTRRDVFPIEMVQELLTLADTLLNGEIPVAVGISYGGPLNTMSGLILGPPNLPESWNCVPIVKWIEEHYRVPVLLCNDADACALAEWKFGAGKGCDNIIFLTFGTGMGAGLILNGKLYSGASSMAGEIGHIRISPYGPVGYGKAGSFEGFCSGSGLAQLGELYAKECRQSGKRAAFDIDGVEISASMLAEAARAGDPTARRAFQACGKQLGCGLSILIDLLNPEKIVLGSIFNRCYDLLWETAKGVIEAECLPPSASVCQVVPAELGEMIGDFAALTVAMIAWEERYVSRG